VQEQRRSVQEQVGAGYGAAPCRTGKRLRYNQGRQDVGGERCRQSSDTRQQGGKEGVLGRSLGAVTGRHGGFKSGVAVGGRSRFGASPGPDDHHQDRRFNADASAETDRHRHQKLRLDTSLFCASRVASVDSKGQEA